MDAGLRNEHASVILNNVVKLHITRKEEETMSEKNVAFTRDRSIPKSYELVLTALFTAIIVVNVVMWSLT